MTTAIAPSELAPETQRVKTPETVLKDVFGYDAFRDGQGEVIHQVCEGKDALVLLPCPFVSGTVCEFVGPRT